MDLLGGTALCNEGGGPGGVHDTIRWFPTPKSLPLPPLPLWLLLLPVTESSSIDGSDGELFEAGVSDPSALNAVASELRVVAAVPAGSVSSSSSSSLVRLRLLPTDVSAVV